MRINTTQCIPLCIAICYANISSALHFKHSQGLKRHLASVVFLPFALTVSTSFPSHATTLTKEYPVFNEVWSLVKENYVEPIADWYKVYQDSIKKLKSGADEEALTRKVLAKYVGDKYTRLLDKNTYESLWKYDAIGVGILFQSDPNQPLIVASPPISGSSGSKAGIQKGEFVYAINGKSTTGMTAMDVLDMLSNDVSPTVTLEVGKTIETKRSIQLARSTEKAINPVSYSIETLKNGVKVGYIRLGDFNAEAVPGIREALLSINQNKEVKDVILDIRGNTGGGFQFALNIGGMFMDNKEMATARSKDNNANVFKSSYSEGVLTDKPLVLLGTHLYPLLLYVYGVRFSFILT